jgi:hypothetical protein
MQVRAANRMAKLKELMNLHMTSANDAFRFFDVDKNGRITFSDFSKLIAKLHEMSGEKAPTYPIIKDLFDTIDIRKDGMIDMHEWQQTFGLVGNANTKISFHNTPLSMWESSREYDQICSLISKNRKLIGDSFKQILGSETKLFTFEQGKSAMDDWLYTHFKGAISDEQLKCLFRSAQVHSESQHGPKYDYTRLLEINKTRHSQ